MRSVRAKAILLFLGGVLALGLLGLASMVGPGSSEAQQDTMRNCPQAGKWAISVWTGDDGTDTGQALATCGAGAVDAAYYIDPTTNNWQSYFLALPAGSTLQTLDDMQGVIAHGAMAASTPTPAATPTPTAPPPSVCNGLPTYSEVVATYPPDVVLTISKFDIVEVINGAWLTEGIIEGRGGEDLVQWYGVQITIRTPTPITINDVTYQPGDKLTVDKDLNYVSVCSWD